jgi:hypothetical protein
VDNQVVGPEADHAEKEDQNGEEGDNQKEEDAEPSIVTPVIKEPPRSFVPKAPYPERLQTPKKGGKLETFWRCSNKSKLISHFWTPSSKYLYMPSS